MNKIIYYQKKKFLNTELYFNLLLKNMDKFENSDNLNTFLNKLYLLNKSLDTIKDSIIKLLNDLENNTLILTKNESNLLEEDKINKSLIKEVTPFLLYYLIYKDNIYSEEPLGPLGPR